MKDCKTLQIANTRFAISCNHPALMERLIENYGGFISEEQPQLTLDLHMEIMSAENSPRRSLMTTVDDNAYENGKLTLKMMCSHHEDIILPILQICLRCAMAVNQPPGLLLHSSGIINEGNAYLFSGVSGSGKSTVCNILADKANFTSLHDDMVAITQSEEGIYAWSTPLSGEMPATFSSGAPLRAIFFLKQDVTNYTTRLNGKEAAKRLSLSLIPPLVASNNGLVNEPMESLKEILIIAERIPCHELHFKPDFSFWEQIEQLFLGESAMAVAKG